MSAGESLAAPAGPPEADLRAAKLELVRRYLVGPSGRFAARTLALVGSVPPGPVPGDNVVGVGIGQKVVDHQLAGTLCVKVYVREKLRAGEIPEADRIQPTVDGVPTDVEQVGLITAWQPSCSQQRRHRQRPAPAGISVGHATITAGTIGALVRDSGRQDNGRRYILSNNHVLANSNAAQVGDPILQPGPLDGGTATDQIGTLARWVPIRFAGQGSTVDAAIAEVQPGVVLPEICMIGRVQGTVQPARDMVVLKHGRTTGLTKGIITDADADIRVHYPGAGLAFFVNTVVIRGLPETTPFSAGGDSGSLIVTSQRRACALLFAGSSLADLTFANPIGAVTRRLRIRLV